VPKIVGDSRIIYHNGDIYAGQFVNEEYHGEGKYVFGDSHPVNGFYKGKFENGRITGEGLCNLKAIKALSKYINVEIKEVEESDEEK